MYEEFLTPEEFALDEGELDPIDPAAGDEDEENEDDVPEVPGAEEPDAI